MTVSMFENYFRIDLAQESLEAQWNQPCSST